MTRSSGFGGARAGKTRTPCSHNPRWRQDALDDLPVVYERDDAHFP